MKKKELKNLAKKIADAEYIIQNSDDAKAVAKAQDTILELSGKTGCIISTGGGAVLDAKNIRNLSKNGKIYFIDRPLEDIVPTSDRPTASTFEAVKKRYEERYPIYKKSADVIIEAKENADIVSEKIKEDFLYESDSCSA